MKINVNGAWKDTKPHVNVGGVWKPVSVGWVNVGGVWKKMYTSEFVFAVPSGEHTNFNLFNNIGLTDSDTIIVNIPADATFRGSNANTPAFNIGNAYIGKQIIINNAGTIIGKGGAGGAGGKAGPNGYAETGSPGETGGTAVYLRTDLPVEFTNTGKILAGGGGGGGGGGASYTHLVGAKANVWQSYAAGGRGGNGGDGGATSGSGGAKGNSMRRGSHLNIYGGNGARGGAGGAAGGKGGTGTTDIHAATATKRAIRGGGAGGAGGAAIDGNSHIVLHNSGTVSGTRTN